MKKRLIYAIATTLSVVFGALFFNGPFFGGSDDSAPQTRGVMDDSAFVNYVHGSAVYYLTAPDSEIINSAKAICARFEAGESAAEIHDSMVAAVPADNAKDAEFFLVGSVTQYCVKYSSKVTPYVTK